MYFIFALDTVRQDETQINYKLNYEREGNN